ncbi:MAG TPA: outer membrane beta-barrel protein [Gemmatimonadales bacterium]|nr:outer membrane beta-barrel protein [Gemmatimonadales bacterium]
MRSFVRCIAFSAVLGVAPAAAQSPFTFGLGGSLNVPLGDASYGLGANSGAGWQGMGLLQIRPFRSRLGFQLDGTYQPFGTMSALGSQSFNGTANVVYEFGRSRTSRVVPYVIGGAGVYNFREAGTTDATYHFGVNGGAGLSLRLFGPGSIFLESRLHNVFNAGLDSSGNAAARLIPITAGFKFTAP